MKPDRVALDAALPDVAMGIRAALATVIPFALAAKLDRPELTWMALGGWLGTLVDPDGPRSQRVRSLVAFALFGSGVVFVTESVAASPPHATAILVLVVFTASIFRSLGAAAATLGTMLSVISAIASARAQAVPSRDALAFGAGATLAIVLSTVVWPVWTHLPVRRGAGAVLHELAEYARALDGLIRDEVPAGDERWIRSVRTHARRIRAALESARALSLAVRARRPGETRRGGNLRLLLGMLESQFQLVVTIATELEHVPDREASCPHATLEAIAKRWDVAHDRIVAHATPDDPHKDPGPPSERAHGKELRDLVAILDRESRVASDLAASIDTASPLAATADGKPPPWKDEVAEGARVLRDSLTIRSTWFRHALRAAIAVAVASALGAKLTPTHAAWVAITCIAVLQPFPGATTTRAIERLVGSALGCIVAAVIARYVTNRVFLAATMFPLSIAAVVSRSRSYRLFTFFLTPLFVPLAMHDPGDTETLVIRVLDVILGGAVAVGASWVVFPAWERKLLPEALTTMQRRVLVYVAHVLARDSDEVIDAARRAAGIALGEAESSLERLLGEPRALSRSRSRRSGRREAEHALELVTFARRLSAATTSLDTLLHRGATENVTTATRDRVERLASMFREAK